MNRSIDKLLRIELTTLFLFTLVSFISFYFQESLPDNYLSINASSEGSVLSYYFFSVIAGVGYYSGLWLVFPFLIFALFYTLLLSRRSFAVDIFNVVPLLFACAFFSSIMASDTLGSGLHYLISKNLDTLQIAGLGVFNTFVFLGMSYRSSFGQALKNTFITLGKLPEYLKTAFFYLNPFRYIREAKSLLKSGKDKTNVMVTNVLKGDQAKKILRKEKIDRQPELISSFTPISKVVEPSSDEIESHIEIDEDKVTVNDNNKLAPKEAVKKYKAKQNRSREKEYYSIVNTLSSSVGRKNTVHHPDQGYFNKIIQALEETLAEFKIDGKIVNVLKGPVVDTFELELGPGVKVSKVTNSENELSMALLGAPIRIVYPMIGRATVGIEVPRNPREIIYLDEVLAAKEYQDSTLKLPVAMGKNAFGETFVVDLASMPHMLVAGATGAGKSVFINTLLVSLLAKKSPSQMKLILIDPKQLELALYATLPHLVMPVITAAKEASVALLWACQEMERRYSILKDMGVRNIEGFNQKIKTASPEALAKIHPHYENEPDEHYELPYLVIIVDEFADLILTKAGKDIENNICRLAAKARAAGIHLVLATQRPSVDVITGLIKSNFPTRVSFRVTSSVDSRTILNSTGAEKLLGKGDMLYRHGTENLRVHSSYVDEDEIEALTTKLAEMPKGFHSGAMDFLENGGEKEADPYAYGSHIAPVSDGSSSSDEYFRDAVKIVIEHRTASASMLQRRMKIGYNRAANLIEEMEAKGIVGPAEGSKRRKVLISSEELV